jgi:hypothetical protein
MEGHVSRDDFERSLLWGILFQPFILVPDIFFFISSHLHAHIAGGLSLLEAAMEHGVVVPSFRSPGTSSFRDALGVVESAGIQGLRPKPENLRIAGRLDDTTRSGGFRFTTWPTDRLLAATYESRLTGILTADHPPLADAWPDDDETRRRLERGWTVSRRWRLDCLEDAVRRSDGGLRRGAFMNALGRSLGMRTPVHDVREIFAAAEGAGLPREDTEALRGICRVMSDCYLYNLASEHGNDAAFPRYDEWSHLVLASTGTGPGTAGTRPWPTMEHTVRLPTPPAMSALPPNTLVGIRRDLYPDYSAAVATWQRQPNPQNEDRVRDAMDAYAGAILEKCRTRGSENVAATHGSGFLPKLGTGVGATASTAALAASIASYDASQLAASILNLAASGIPALLMLGAGGFSYFRRLRETAGTAEEEETVRLSANPDLSTPTADGG